MDTTNVAAWKMTQVLFNFPEELCYEILQSLPTKTLCRFLSVCKTWHRLITSQDFISSHANRNLNTQSNNYMLVRVVRPNKDKEEEFLFYPHPKKREGRYIRKSSEVPSFIAKIPRKKNSNFHKIVGSCNGLVCMVDNDDIILWNPSIHKFGKLPKLRRFSIPISHLNCNHWLGFGVNLLNGDFKVVRIIGKKYSMVGVEVYSLKTRKWVEINNSVFGSTIDWVSGSHVYLHGRSHWIGRLAGNKLCSVVSFDMSEEVFQEVLVPEQLARMVSRWMHQLDYLENPKLVTMTSEDCLAIAINERRNRIFQIWVMKEYGVLESWTNLYRIDMKLMNNWNFVGFMKNGNILKRGANQLTYFDPLTNNRVSTLRISGQEFHVDNYMETLVLLKSRFNI